MKVKRLAAECCHSGLFHKKYNQLIRNPEIIGIPVRPVGGDSESSSE